MKGILSTIAAVMICVSCSSTSEDAVLNIKVEDPTSDEVVLVYHNNIDVLPLDADGNASFIMKGSEMAYPKLFHGRESIQLYLEEGDAASVSFNGQDLLGTYVFDGDKAPAVKYLNTVSLIALPDEDYALPFEEYRNRLTEMEEEAIKLLKANGLSSIGNFQKNESDRIRYSYAAQLLMYPMAHAMLTSDIAYQPEDGYFKYMESYVVEDERLACLDEYRAFIAECMHLLDPDGKDITAIYPKTVRQMKFAADYLSDPEVREIIMHHIAASYIDNFGVKDINELENLYNTYVKDSSLVSSFTKKYERWDLSQPGKRSPGFRAQDIDGKVYTLADFRGKYVYIDMWATWCGPCKQEVPYLKQLEEEFKDAQIVFLGLSVDKDKSAWEKMVKEGGLSGTQLYLGTGSSFQEAYRIEAIPRFILLDKEGVIISNDMSRPSEEKTAVALRNLEEIR